MQSLSPQSLVVFKSYYCDHIITAVIRMLRQAVSSAVPQLASAMSISLLVCSNSPLPLTSQTPAASMVLASPKNADASMSYIHRAWPQEVILSPLGALSGVISHNETVSNYLVPPLPKASLSESPSKGLPLASRTAG